LPRLDVSRPNIHDSKKEFLRERDLVISVADHLGSVITEILGDRKNEAHIEMTDRLNAVIDLSAAKNQRSKEISSARDLALQNIAQTGFHYNSLLVIAEMMRIYQERLKELMEQEVEFWTVSNRPPNYYARTIALRLARLYASEKRQKPTFGIARDGNHPSTEFGRALEKVFSVLGIEAAVRNAADWALEQLTEQDINPPQNSLASMMGGLFGEEPTSLPVDKPRSAMEKIADELAKKGS